MNERRRWWIIFIGQKNYLQLLDYGYNIVRILIIGVHS